MFSILLSIVFVPTLVLAHPGNVDRNAGHVCRTNCSEYGLKTGEYHSHEVISGPAGPQDVEALKRSFCGRLYSSQSGKDRALARANQRIASKYGFSCVSEKSREEPRHMRRSLPINDDPLATDPIYEETAQVMRVIDGDTFEVRLEDGSTDTVRIIGIDSPETGYGGRTEQCYAQEASTALKRTLARRGVFLEEDGEDDKDDYGRLLRYVSLRHVDIGKMMILRGFARHYSFFDHSRKQEYAEAEQAAKDHGMGLWKACVNR